ncbi:phage major capsid protein [Vibrio cyclitrophicus]
MSDQEVRDFSFVDMILSARDNKSKSGHTAPWEVLESREFLTPEAIRAAKRENPELFRNQSPAGSVNAGMGGTVTDSANNMIQTDLLSGSFIDVVRNMSVIMSAGITTLSGLSGPIEVPRLKEGAVAGWVPNEGDDSAQTAPKFEQIGMDLKQVSAHVVITAQALVQSKMALETFIRLDLARAVADAIDMGALYGEPVVKDAQDQDVETGEPLGLVNQDGIPLIEYTGNGPTYEDLAEAELLLETANQASERLMWAVSPDMKKHARINQKFPTDANGGGPLWETGGYLIERPAIVSNQVEDGELLFGNWRDLIMGLWSGLEILVDPYSNSLSGSVIINVRQWCNFIVRRPDSFVHVKKEA